MDVWFDDWQIQAGDSIPGKLNEGLGAFEAFVLVWSANAKRSNWVRHELHSAITRAVNDNTARIIPCKLDETPLPALIADRKWISFTDPKEGILELTGDLTGARSRKDRLLAIQEAFAELDVDWIMHPMVGPPMLCCPRCGNEKLEGFHNTDDKNDRSYAGLQCPACRWSNGGEI